jgi:hypothetical protein
MHSRGEVDPAAKAVGQTRPNATMAAGRVAPCVRQKRKLRVNENSSASVFIDFVIGVRYFYHFIPAAANLFKARRC